MGDKASTEQITPTGGERMTFTTSTDDRNPVPGHPDGWVRPLGAMEKMCALAGNLGSLTTVQAMWVTSSAPLTKEMMTTSLKQLTRRIAILNLCIQQRGSKMWYREVQNMIVDLEILQGDTMEVFRDVLESSFDSKTGPLWRARLVLLPPGEESPRGVVAKNHAMVVFGVHHAITDATTNLILCREFVSILNDTLQERPISNEVYPLGAPLAEAMSVGSTKTFQMKFILKHYYKVMIRGFNQKVTVNGAMPLPKSYTTQNMLLSHVFSAETTQRLRNKCKEEQTSVHSCIAATTTAALYDVVQRKSKRQVNQIKFYYSDSICLRRYYPEDVKNHVGCHFTMHQQKMSMSNDQKTNFWSTARNSKSVLHRSLEDKSVLKNLPVSKCLAHVAIPNSHRIKKGHCNLTDNHFATSNMGDVTSLLGDPDPKEPVAITDLLRSVKVEIGGQLFLVTFHTFRERLYLSIDYYTNKISHEDAKEIFEELKVKVNSLANTGEL